MIYRIKLSLELIAIGSKPLRQDTTLLQILG